MSRGLGDVYKRQVHYDYIVEQLCENRDKPVLACNGKCYLGKQLVAEDEGSSDVPQPLPPAADFDKLLTIRHIPASFAFDVSENFNGNPFSTSSLNGTDHPNPVFRPPII